MQRHRQLETQTPTHTQARPKDREREGKKEGERERTHTSLSLSLSRIPAVVTAVIASFNTRELSGKDAYLARNQPWWENKSQK